MKKFKYLCFVLMVLFVSNIFCEDKSDFAVSVGSPSSLGMIYLMLDAYDSYGTFQVEAMSKKQGKWDQNMSLTYEHFHATDDGEDFFDNEVNVDVLTLLGGINRNYVNNNTTKVYSGLSVGLSYNQAGINPCFNITVLGYQLKQKNLIAEVNCGMKGILTIGMTF